MNQNDFYTAVQNIRTSGSFPIAEMVRGSPGTATVLSKLVRTQYNPQETQDRDLNTITHASQFVTLSNKIALNKANAQTTLQLLPDLELGAQILISSILSPVDMMSSELIYSYKEDAIPGEVGTLLINALKTEMETGYKMSSSLEQKLRNMLIEKGAHVAAVLPENTIDDMINSDLKLSTESLKSYFTNDSKPRPLGLIGPAKSVVGQTGNFMGLESMTNDRSRMNYVHEIVFESKNATGINTGITVTDNPAVLRLPMLNQKIRADRIDTAYAALSPSMESMSFKTQASDHEFRNILFRRHQPEAKPLVTVKSQEQLVRNAVGRPLVLTIPTEAVIPVHVPGSPERQIGFFVLLEPGGNFLEVKSGADHYRELQARMDSTNNSLSTALTARIGQMTNGGYNATNPDLMLNIFGEIIEKDLVARLKNGAYGSDVSVAANPDIYYTMLTRALSQQHTQMLFIPAEFVTYYALKYDDYGIGKSLLDDNKIINSLRSILLFSDVMTSLKNSIGRTNVKLKLSPEDPDPQKSIELFMHEIAKTRQQQFPLGVSNPGDLVEYIQKAGYQFSFEGHPRIPDMGVEFSESASNFPKPDQGLSDQLRKMSIMGIWLTPEMVDTTANVEFAETIISSNLMLGRRVLQVQEKFTPFVTDNIQKIAFNTPSLLSELRSIIMKNIGKLLVADGADLNALEETKKQDLANYLVRRFLKSLEVTLPKPATTTTTAQTSSFTEYLGLLDASIEAYVSDKYLTENTVGMANTNVAELKELLRAYFVRQWLSENNVMPELAELVTLNAKGEPDLKVFEAQREHVQAISKALTALVVGLQQNKEGINKVMEERVGEQTASTPTDAGGDEASAGLDESLTQTPPDFGESTFASADQSEAGDGGASPPEGGGETSVAPAESSTAPATTATSPAADAAPAASDVQDGEI